MHPLLALYFSANGRLRRKSYWWAAIVLTIAFAALFALLEKFLGTTSTLVLYPPFLLGALMLMIKRLHDSARSAWWLVIVIVPVLGPLWLFLVLGFGRGTRGENQYGNDPRIVNADYLTVQIAS